MTHLITNFKIFENHLDNNTKYDIEKILHSYLFTALWTDELDGKYDVDDFDEKTIIKSKIDIENFLKEADGHLEGLDEDSIGHNLWLTRNHHGAGFWDLKEIDKENGKILTEICVKLKEVNVFENNGKVIIE